MLVALVVVIVGIVVWKKWDAINGFFARIFGADE